MTSHRWKRFFIEAGLPTDISDNYAIIFTENRIRFDMLDELNKEILYDMGIKKMGDVISILRHAKEVHKNSYREKVFQTDIDSNNTNVKDPTKTIHQADSTNNKIDPRISTTASTSRIVQLPKDNPSRIVKLSQDSNSAPIRQVVNKTDFNMKNNPPPKIIRNVTGLNVMKAPIRKRIEPPSDDDEIDTTTPASVKISKSKLNLITTLPEKEIEAQRVTNFATQIQRSIISNNNSNITTVNTVKQQTKLQRVPIQSRLNTNNKSNPLLTKTIQTNTITNRNLLTNPLSVKDRLGKKSVFKRLEVSSSSRSIFSRLGTK